MQVHFYQKPQKLQVENKSESDLDSTRHFFFELRKKHFFSSTRKEQLEVLWLVEVCFEKSNEMLCVCSVFLSL